MRISYLNVLCLDAQGAELSILRSASATLRERRVGAVIAELIWVPLHDVLRRAAFPWSCRL
jgi:hypothetical protein